MYCIRKVNDDYTWVGADCRRLALFEGVFGVPDGVSFNSYLLMDDKTVLFDTVDSAVRTTFRENVAHVLNGKAPDYLVVHHMEPDHSSSIKTLRLLYPEMQIVGNAKTLQMLDGYYGIHTLTREVKEGESISLGQKNLSFYMAPMVHWPEVMVTYCPEHKVLFSADAFGTFGALNGGILDSQLSLDHFWDEMRRYYACIVGKYGAPVQKALQKLSGLPIETICSTHGPVWQQEIGRVIGIYDQLSRYEGEPGVVIAYGSMYGNTAQMAEKIARELTVQGVKNIIVYNLSYADISNVIRDIFKYDTLIVGSPTYNGELFPEVGSLLQKISERCIPCRKFAYFGSYTWAGAAVRLLGEFAQKMKWEAICQPTEMKQGYDDQGAQCCTALAKAIAEKIR